MVDFSGLLPLLQLASPALPVGAYSYSEGLEALVEDGKIADSASLRHWVEQELHYGAIRVEAAVMVRCYRAIATGNSPELLTWNAWLTATRETEELRSQSWQMGRSLLRLWLDLVPSERILDETAIAHLLKEGCNFACAFAIVAVSWNIDLRSALLGYLYSWASNLVSAGVKLIPLGQTAGQTLLLTLQSTIATASSTILDLPDEALDSCGWGLAIASMTHETQYSRLFRS